MTRIYGYALDPESGAPQSAAPVRSILWPSTRATLQGPVPTGSDGVNADPDGRWELNLLPTVGSGRVIKLTSLRLFTVYADIPVATTGGAGDLTAIDVSTLLVDPTTLDPIPDDPSVYLPRALLGVPDGVASLGSDGILTASQRPAGGGGGGAVDSVTAGDATVTVGGTSTDPTVRVNVIPESKVTNLVSDLSTLTSAVAGKVASVAATDSTITIGGTATAPTVGVNAIAESRVTGLVSDLAGKAASVHTHVETDVINLVSDLAAKAADSAVVHNTGAETVAGVKTFSSSPVVPSAAFPESAVANLVTDLAAKALDTAAVHKTGAETIAGVKTFSSAPVVPSASFPESAVTNLTTDLAAKAVDSAVVHNTGAESVAGVKTFSSAPVVPSAAFPESAVANLVTDLAGKAASVHTHVESDVTSLVSDLAAKIPKSTVTAKGDLLVATGSGVVVALPVSGTNGRVLTEDSTQTDGVKWATPSAGTSLTVVAPLTASATVAANTIVPIDTTSASVVAGLPNAPADGTQVVLKHITLGIGNTATYACAGTDVLNRSGGSTSGSLATSSQATWLVYKAGSPGIWLIAGSDFSLSQLDARLLDSSALAVGDESMWRGLVSNNALSSTSGTLRLTFFTARKSEVTTQVRTATGGTAAGATPSLCQVGLFSVDASDNGTLVAFTANDTTLWAATNTAYFRNWSTPYQKVAGQRYALGLLVVTAATAPTWPGSAALATGVLPDLAQLPRISGQITSQSTMPSTFTVAAVGGASGSINRYYGVVLP